MAEDLDMRGWDERTTPRTDGQRPALAGLLEVMPLADVLGSLSVNGRTGRVRVWAGDRVGTIHVSGGRPIHAGIGAARGAEAIYRMLSLSNGRFRVDFSRSPGIVTTLNEPLAGLVVEGRRRREAYEKVAARLPPMDAVLIAVPGEMYGLESVELDILARCDGTSTLGDIIDQSHNALETLEGAARLWQAGAVAIQSDPNHDPPRPHYPAEVRPPRRSLGTSAAILLAVGLASAAAAFAIPLDHETTPGGAVLAEVLPDAAEAPFPTAAPR